MKKKKEDKKFPTFGLLMVAVTILSIIMAVFAMEQITKEQQINHTKEMERIDASISAYKNETQRVFDSLPICTYRVVGTNIYSLERNNEIYGKGEGKISGSMGGGFFLGFGSIGGSMQGQSSLEIGEKTKYYFYYETEDGGLVLDQVSGTTPIYERDDVEPKLLEVIWFGDYDCKQKYIEKLEKNRFCQRYFSLNQLGGYWKDCASLPTISGELYTLTNPYPINLSLGEIKLIVPKGTIKIEYGVN